MIVWCYFLFVVNIITAAESVLGDKCPYCEQQAHRCAPGREVRNECVRCVCAPDGSIYRCNATSCSDEQRENVILGKPTQATCEPRAQYSMDDVTCMCRHDGSWPHDKCELLFKSLHNKTTTASEPRPIPKRKAQRCIPNSYFINDCNVCMCSPEGEVERSRCTRNVCDEHKTRRRSHDQVHKQEHGTCVTGTFFSLSPCQLCYCRSPSKIVCAASDSDGTVKQIGNYNFTSCGKDLLSELLEIVPSGLSHKSNNTSPPSKRVAREKSTTTTTQHPEKKALRVNDMKEDSEESNEKVDIGETDKINTVVPFSDSSEEHAQNDDRSGGSDESDAKVDKKMPKDEPEINKPMKDVARQQTTKPNKIAPEAKESKKEINNKEKDNKEVDDKDTDDKETDDKENVIEISIPSMLQRLLNFALRKSMVKMDAQDDCVVGSTKREGCNQCFCLNNGKLLCTTKHCKEDEQR